MCVFCVIIKGQAGLNKKSRRVMMKVHDFDEFKRLYYALTEEQKEDFISFLRSLKETSNNSVLPADVQEKVRL